MVRSVKYSRAATEEAWPNGPLRRIGTGKGSPSIYVCRGCLKAVGGVYSPDWTCDVCRSRLKLVHGNAAIRPKRSSSQGIL